MKKLVGGLVLFLMLAVPVLASDNTLYLTEKDNKIYYDDELYDKEVFMKHIDMLPGGSYTDELTIDNATGIPISLYLKVSEREQSEEANELLDNIFMKVYFNDSLIYDGRVKGLDYSSNGVNLQDSVLLKNFSKDEKAKIRVELNLSKDYSNIDYNDYSYIDWKFIAQFDKIKVDGADTVVEVIPAPSTGINKNYILVIIASIGLCTVGSFIIVLARKKKNKEQ